MSSLNIFGLIIVICFVIIPFIRGLYIDNKQKNDLKRKGKKKSRRKKVEIS